MNPRKCRSKLDEPKDEIYSSQFQVLIVIVLKNCFNRYEIIFMIWKIVSISLNAKSEIIIDDD